MSIWERNPECKVVSLNYGKQRSAPFSGQSRKFLCMKMKFIGIGLFLVSFFSCTKRLCSCDPAPQITVKAMVINVSDISCNRPLLEIDASDTAILRAGTGLEGMNFVANELTPSLQVNNQKLFIEVAALKPAEDFACTAIGTTYPHIKVISARARN